jgi:hypothetical protein
VAWQNVELARILQDVGSRQDVEQESCLDIRKQPLGWLELGKDGWMKQRRSTEIVGGRVLCS